MNALTPRGQDTFSRQSAQPAPPAVRAVPIILAWGVMLAITLPLIIWRSYGFMFPGGLLVVCALPFVWPTVRALRGYLLAVLALTTGAVVVFLIANNAAYAEWVNTVPSGVRILVAPQFGVGLRLITVVLVAVTLIGSRLKRRDLFLVRSDMSATSQFHLTSRRSIPWWLVAGLLFVIVQGSTISFLALSTHFSLTALPQVLTNLPFILLAAAFNAFVEEFGWRSVLLARLNPLLGPGQANLLQATYFGLTHYYGTPGGPVGSLMAFGLGWMFGKSVLETHGFTVNYVTHVAVDAIIFAFFVMAVA